MSRRIRIVQARQFYKRLRIVSRRLERTLRRGMKGQKEDTNEEKGKERDLPSKGNMSVKKEAGEAQHLISKAPIFQFWTYPDLIMYL